MKNKKSLRDLVLIILGEITLSLIAVPFVMIGFYIHYWVGFILTVTIIFTVIDNIIDKVLDE